VNATATEAAAPEAAAPPPTFDVLPLSSDVRRAVDEAGYVNPTPVQVAVWEPATRGKDAVVQARTGTGKTASFGLPIVDKIVRKSQAGPQALVLCPTRELAVQVSGELDRLGKYREIRVLSIYGGASMERQVDAIRAGAQVIVGTPGRVLDHIRRGTLDVSTIRLLVLDEADEMLSMGFERELTAILDALPTTRQTLLFSATVPPDIERIAKKRLKDPEFVTLSGDHIGALSIDHFVYHVAADKVGTLVRILETENPESAVVFCNTKDETEVVAHALSQRGYDADWLNGDLPQSERESVMRRTREGKLRFLVATDVAARGIDISHLTHVINYDFPFDAETYVHRTGRTGRAGRTGTAISLIAPQNIGALYMLRLTYKIKPIERRIPSTDELKTRAESDLVGMLAEAFIAKGVHPEDRALARRLMTHDQSEEIIAGLLREYLGARPDAQTEASQLRRANVRRGSLKRRDERMREALEREAAEREAHERKSAGSAPSEAASMTGPAAAGTSTEAAPARDDRSRGNDRRDVRRERDDRRDRDDRERRPERPRREERAREPHRPVDASEAWTTVAVPSTAAGTPAAAAPSADAAAQATAVEGANDTTPRGRRSRDRRATRTTEGGAHRELAHWAPPAEEGDDEPVLPARSTTDAPSTTVAAEPTFESALDDGTELFIGVGRRDGVRAQDIARTLCEVAGLANEHIQRIRVRDRHTFVTVRKDDADRAIASLHRTTIAGRPDVTVEVARPRAPRSDEGSPATSEG
jgi:ATP-dependent RNA helicase DeaD